jgi:hypothetical protein
MDGASTEIIGRVRVSERKCEHGRTACLAMRSGEKEYTRYTGRVSRAAEELCHLRRYDVVSIVCVCIGQPWVLSGMAHS